MIMESGRKANVKLIYYTVIRRSGTSHAHFSLAKRATAVYFPDTPNHCAINQPTQ